MMIQQFSGIRKDFRKKIFRSAINFLKEKCWFSKILSAVQFYSTIMFESAGMENPKLGTVIVGILKIVFTIVTIFIMNRLRRKLLMQMSLGNDTLIILPI